jgi:quercetin dioxygenase-like cupin family protein
MKTLSRVTCATVLALLITAAAHADLLQPMRVTPDELTWKPTPMGNQRAMLAGDPQKAGLYIYHTRYATGYRNRPHFHPDERVVTILSGTLLVGYGEQLDESKMKALPAGSVLTEPPKQPHFVWAKDGEVVIQVIGYGPSATTPVATGR